MKQLLFLLICTYLLTGCANAQDQRVDADKFEAAIKQPEVQLLDVRNVEEYETGHIENAMLANINDGAEFNRRVEALDKDKPVYVYCLAGSRSERAANELRAKGFKNVVELKGGINAWRKSGKTVEGTEKVREMTLNEYEAITKSAHTVMIDFGAEWCPPCRKMQPVWEELQQIFSGKATFAKVDAGTQAALMAAQKIEQIPTFILYSGGKEIWRGSGIIAKKEMETRLKEATTK